MFSRSCELCNGRCEQGRGYNCAIRTLKQHYVNSHTSESVRQSHLVEINNGARGKIAKPVQVSRQQVVVVVPRTENIVRLVPHSALHRKAVWNPTTNMNEIHRIMASLHATKNPGSNLWYFTQIYWQLTFQVEYHNFTRRALRAEVDTRHKKQCISLIEFSVLGITPIVWRHVFIVFNIRLTAELPYL